MFPAYKSFVVFVTCLCLVSVQAYSQRKTFRINPGERFTDAIPQAEIYSYPNFVQGTVYLKGDRYSTARLNYNALFGDMQFIDEKGDTLGLDNERTIQFIAIQKDTFYYDQGYLKLVATYDGTKLASRKFFSFTNKQKIGGFGELSSASIDAYDRISSGSTFNELVAKELVTLSQNNLLYVGDKFNHFKPANKKNLVAFFAKNEPVIKQYFEDNNVDFYSAEELTKLILFMQASPVSDK
jgi:hypothetical protein